MDVALEGLLEEEVRKEQVMIHPHDAEEILQCALNLVPVCTGSGMAKIALLEESKSKAEVCVCCCCTRNET